MDSNDILFGEGVWVEIYVKFQGARGHSKTMGGGKKYEMGLGQRLNFGSEKLKAGLLKRRKAVTFRLC